MAKYLRSATPAALAVGLDALFSGQLKFIACHKVIHPSKAAFAMEKFVYVRVAEYRRSATLAALAMGLDALFNNRIKFITRSKIIFLLEQYPDPIIQGIMSRQYCHSATTAASAMGLNSLLTTNLQLTA